MDSYTYIRVYHTQPLPENKRRTIQRLGSILLGLEVLLLLVLFLARLAVIHVSMMMLAIYALAAIITLFFCIIGVMLYRAYYVFWYTPFSQDFSFRLSLGLGGVVYVCFLNIIALILLIVIFAVTIPQQKLKREMLVKTTNMPSKPTPYHIIQYDDTAPGHTASQMPVESQPIINATSSPISTVADQSQPAVSTVAPYATVNTNQELCFAIILLVISIIGVLWSTYASIDLVNTMFNASPTIRGTAAGLGIFFFAPSLIGAIIILVISCARTRLLRSYRLQNKCKPSIIIHTVSKILSAVSFLPFIVFLFYGCRVFINGI